MLDTKVQKNVFPNYMGLGCSVELALVNLELNEPVLELGTSDYCDPLKRVILNATRCRSWIGYRGGWRREPW